MFWVSTMQRSGAGGKPTVSDYAFRSHTPCILQGYIYPALSGFKANPPGYYNNMLILLILHNGTPVAIWIIVNVINMFRLGMGAYAIHRNNYMPFVNGAIFASMETVQPQWIDVHEAFCSLRLYNIYCLFGGVLEACDEFSAVRIRTHTQTD